MKKPIYPQQGGVYEQGEKVAGTKPRGHTLYRNDPKNPANQPATKPVQKPVKKPAS